MRSKLIHVDCRSKDDKVRISLYQRLPLRISKFVIYPFDSYVGCACVAREKRLFPDGVLVDFFTSVEGWLALLNNSSENRQGNGRSDAFTNVSNLSLYREKIIQWPYGASDLNPSPLANFEVVPKVKPLHRSDDSVDYGEWYGYYFKPKFPLIPGFVPGIIGVFGICWGWFNLRLERHLPASGMAFIGGCILWAFALFSLLPWWARE